MLNLGKMFEIRKNPRREEGDGPMYRKRNFPVGEGEPEPTPDKEGEKEKVE